MIAHTMDLVPPQDRLAEQELIRSMLHHNQVIDDIRSLIQADDFYDGRHRIIVQAIFDLSDTRLGQGIDLITLSDELHRQQLVDAAGGMSYFAELAHLALHHAHATHYAKIVKCKAVQRKLQHAAQSIFREASCPSDPDQLLSFCEQQIQRISDNQKTSDTKPLKEALHVLLDRSEAKLQGKIVRRYTGISELDTMVKLNDGQLIIIAARTAVGKSLLGIQLAKQIMDHASAEEAVFIASLEMQSDEIASRLVSAFGEVPTDVSAVERVLNKLEVKQLCDAVRKLESDKIFINDAGNQTLASIASDARRLKRIHGLGLIVVDYLQLVTCEQNRSKTRAESLGEVSRSLKRLAKELHCPVIALCQLNREAGDYEEPQLRHIRESGNIEQDADMVWLLWRDDRTCHDPSDDQMIYLKVAKNRQGPTGTIQLLHRKQFMRFEDSSLRVA